LLQKLHYEFEQLKKEPNNTYVAFSFFVTAEHLLDWLYPGKANRSKREQVRASSELLQICSHIANGAKHFEVEAKHHQSVSDSGRSGGMFPPRLFPPRLFPPRSFPNGGLFVRLQGDAEKAFGPSVSVMDLAAKVLEFWDNHQDLKTAGQNGRC
jgi:hypothetical protein